jgi:mannosyltransferase
MGDAKGRQRAAYIALAAVLAACVAILLAYRVGRPLHIDDTHSTFHAFDGVWQVVEHLRTDSHPPLYFLLMALWMPVFGMGELALRIPSILFYLSTGVVLFVYGSKMEDQRAGLLVALIFLASPLAVYHAHTVRMYALLGLISALSTTLFLVVTKPDRPARRGEWAAYLAVNCLGTLTQYWFFFLLAGQATGALLFAHGNVRKKALGVVAVSVLPFAVLWSPVLLQQMQGTPTSWMEPPGGLWLLGAPLNLYGLGEQRMAAIVVYVGLAIVCGLRLGRPKPRLTSLKEVAGFLRLLDVRLLIVILTSMLVLGYAVSQITPVYHVRCLMAALPAFALLVGLALWRLGDRDLRLAFALAFVIGSGFVYYRALVDTPARDDRPAATYLIEHYQEGDEAVFITLAVGPLTHYLRALAPDRNFSTTVFPQEVAEHIGWRNVDEMLADRRSLELEADRAVEGWSTRSNLQHVWLFAGGDRVPTRILVDELRRAFILDRKVNLRGHYYKEIQVYAPRPGAAPPRESE